MKQADLLKQISFYSYHKKEYKKTAEVYEFYAYSSETEKDVKVSDETYTFDEKVKAKEFDGYFGSETIGKKDSHYGWNIGKFFVSGYTASKEDKEDDKVVFLKNVGDKVTLWFKLEQDINKLNGDEDLSITADKEGYDQYFETAKTDFGKGTLIIRHTDYNNNKTKPQIYTNYLAANTTLGADTKVQLFEEGDYEVALNYEVTDDQLIDKIGHYRVFFKFSVRNGNCMVYLFDIATGKELTNNTMTENGFKLDLAKSRYLNVNVTREILADSADELIKDTRFNGVAKDGAEYTDEGIYTITVKNEYIEMTTIKKIYVGNNKVMKAHMTSDLRIDEINNLVKSGATIDEAGEIKLSPVSITSQESTQTKAVVIIILVAIIGLIVICTIVISTLAIKYKKKSSVQRNEEDEDGKDEK